MQMQDRLGQQFGNYRLIRLIGCGGYAEVYLAEHIQLPDLQHAIKILTGSNLQESQRDEFLAEARIIANLQRLSDHIVQIRDFGIQSSNDGTGNGIPYFVMEYAAAGTLRDLYPRGTQMPLERIVFYVNQVAEALQCAHEQNPPVVHRDIKPENMLLRTRDHVLLSDFGIAITGSTTTLPRPLTAPGVVGTAAYIAPERLKGRIKRTSDQYSLGVVVYEWLCGFRPFQGTDDEICYQHLTMLPPPLHERYPYITPEVEAVVMRTMAKKPEERYPRIQAFAQALAKAAQQTRSPARSTPTVVVKEAAEPAEARLAVRQPPRQPHHIAPGFDDTTEVATARQLLSSLPAPTPPAEQRPLLLPLPPVVQPAQPSRSLTLPSFQPPARGLRDFFDFSPQFAYDRRYSIFRNSGIPLNILVAIATALMTRNIWIFPVGLLYTSLLFALCVRAVEETLAACFGILVALYWGWLGWLLGGMSAEYLDINHVFAAGVAGALFFIISVSLHIWYVLRKNL